MGAMFNSGAQAAAERQAQMQRRQAEENRRQMQIQAQGAQQQREATIERDKVLEEVKRREEEAKQPKVEVEVAEDVPTETDERGAVRRPRDKYTAKKKPTSGLNV